MRTLFILAFLGNACGRIGYDPLAIGASDAGGAVWDAPSVTSDAAVDSGADVTADAPGLGTDAALDAPGNPSPDGDADADAPSCPWPPPTGLLAEWRADGDERNEVACSPWQATVQGTVPYGAGRAGSAWQFRSDSTSPSGDPDYVEVPASAGYSFPQFTVDVWVKQTHFNVYNGSNRCIVCTGFKDFTFEPGEWMLYVHENTSVGAILRLTPLPGGTTPGVDYTYVGCGEGAGEPGGVPLDTWARYTVTFDGASMKCFRDGVLRNEAAVGTHITAAADALVVGRNYPGDVDALRVFSRALDASEIEQGWP